MSRSAHPGLLGLILLFLQPWDAQAGGPDTDGDGVGDASDACPNTPAGVAVDREGRPLGDFDADCDTDVADFSAFLAGYTGPLDSGNRPQPGDLVIAEVMQNPSAVLDSSGEWFEIINVTDRTISIAGLTFADEGANSFTIPVSSDVELGAGARFVLGNNGDPLTNGGVTVDYDYNGMALGNGDDELIIFNGGVVIDRIAWDGGISWPDPSGASMCLNGALDPALVDNNDPANWCTSDSVYGAGDRGTPGAPNDLCP